MKSDDYDKKREWSKQAEVAVADLLKRQGHRVLATYDFSGEEDNKAPRLEAENPRDSLVVPDLQVVKDGKVQWFEVKRKKSAPFYYKRGCRQTGFELRHWKHYGKVQQESGLPVHVVFVHDAEREARFASLDELDEVKQEDPLSPMARGGMVFFPYDELKPFATLDDLGLEPGSDRTENTR